MPTLPLEQMTVTEKLQVMEELWSDLCCNQNHIPVHQWHKETLDRREKLVNEGKATFVDWETAKKRIADRISKNNFRYETGQSIFRKQMFE